MLRHSVKGLYKKGYWDHGGTLNEMDSPGEVPDKDVIECENWKVHPDGKSRVKRMGYQKFDTGYTPQGKPIRDIQEYVDPDNVKKVLVVTKDSALIRSEIPTYERKYLEGTNGSGSFYSKHFFLYEFQDKICLYDIKTNTTSRVLKSSDGETWDLFFEISGCFSGVGYQGIKAIEFNNHLFISNNVVLGTEPRIIEWNGSTIIKHLTSINNLAAFDMIRFDGKLWTITAITPASNDHFIVYYYNGSSWQSIVKYDGAAYININKDTSPSPNVFNRIARLFVRNNILYLIVTVWSTAKSDWTWQVWKFKTSTYDQFDKIYDSANDNETYALSSIIAYENEVYVIGSKLASNGSITSNEQRLYKSSNMVNWTVEKSSLTLGFPVGEIIFENRLYLNCHWWHSGLDDFHKIYYFVNSTKDFFQEQEISTNPVTNETGAICLFKGDLYISKYREVYKRIISTTQWTEVYSSSQSIDEPVHTGTIENRAIVFGFDTNFVVEGDDVYQLGITPPTSPPSVAEGSAGAIIGKYKYLVTFMRTGNYPCEGNPSPESAEITVVTSLGSEKVLNPSFTTVPDTDWIWGTGWVHDTTIKEADHTPGNILALEQNVNAIAGELYQVIFTVKNKTLGSVVPQLGGVNGVGAYSNMTYTQQITATGTGNLKFTPTADFDGSIDDVSVRLISGKKINLSNIPISPDPKVNARRIYRILNDGEIFFWLDDILDNSTTTYEDNFTDQDLMGSDEVSYDRWPPPKGKFFEIWDNRLWICDGKFVYFTNTGTFEEWCADNFLVFQRREPGDLIGLKAFGDNLYVFKNSFRFKVEKQGESLYQINQLPEKIGTDCHASIAVCDLLLIWHSEHGIEVFNGNNCYRPILSRFVKRTLDSLNKEFIHKAFAGHDAVDGKYWFAFPTGSNTEPDKVLVFDYLINVFTVYKFAKGVTALKTITDSLNRKLLLSGTPDGYIYQHYSGYKDDETAITANFKTGWKYIAGEREIWNVIRRMFVKYILPTGKTITMKIYSNFHKDPDVTISLSGSTPTTSPELRNEILRRVNLGVRGYYACFEFINAEDTGGECRVMGWDAFFKRRIWKQTVKGN